MRVLGIDPGSRITGYGIVEGQNGKLVHVDNGNIAPDSGLALSVRLRTIFESLKEIIEKYNPDTVAVENVFVAKNVRSSLLLGHARGIAMVTASLANLDVSEYTPLEVKKALVGTGGASKEQVQKMVKIMLSLPEVACEDASDALAVAICHLNSETLRSKIKAGTCK